MSQDTILLKIGYKLVNCNFVEENDYQMTFYVEWQQFYSCGTIVDHLLTYYSQSVQGPSWWYLIFWYSDIEIL
jgi:hypothetical protein